MRIGLQLLCGLVLIFALAAWFVLEIFVEEIKPGVRSATEDTLVDMAQMLAPLALDDLQEGKMADGRLASAFARLNQSPINALIDGHLKQQAEYRIYVVDRWGKVVYDSDGVDLGKDYSRWNDVYRTLRGEYGARSTRSDPDDPASSVMHVAAPLREGDDILGSLTVAKPNRTLLPMIERSEHQLLQGAALLLFISLLIGALLVWWLNRAIGKLVHYADAVSHNQPASLPRLYSPELDRLGRSLETMRRQLDGKAYIEAYVHSLTHELKSPLAAIRGAGELLAEAPPLDVAKRFIGNINLETARMQQLIERMLQLAKLESGQGLDRQAIAPATLGRRALDVSPAGSTVRLTGEMSADGYCFRVRDQGPGIPDYALPRIFERFYSLPRPDKGKSSGLGLSFATEVARQHGGHLSLGNQPDGGVLAELWLPTG
jgi:two-component system, OmpR family, sensor histidine kinase CreC